MRLLLQRTLQNRRMLGQNRDTNTGGVTNPSPNKAHWIPTEKATRKKKKKKKSRGHLHLPWKLSEGATGLPETCRICLPLSWHTGTEHRGLNCHQARKTPWLWEPGNPEGIFCTPRGGGNFSCPATQRREASWGGTNSSLHRRDTHGRQRAVCCPHDREEGVVQKPCSLSFFHHKHIFLIFHMEPSIFLQIFSTFQQSTEVWFSPKTAEGKHGRRTDTTDNRCTSPLNRTTAEKEVGLRNRVLPVLVTLLLSLEALLRVTEPAIA